MARQGTIWTEGTHTVHLFSIKIGRLIIESEVVVCMWWLHFCVRQRGRWGGERYVTVSLFCQNQIMRNQSHCILPCFFLYRGR